MMIFFLKNSFLPKNSSGHVEFTFDDPSGFLPATQASWAESRKLMEKNFLSAKIFFCQKFSLEL